MRKNDDVISRQAAIDIERNATVDTNPSHFEAHQKFTQFMDDAEISSFGRWQWSNGFNTALTAVGIDLKKLPSAHPEIIHCWECIYYDPEHIEKNGVRYEYEDMPKDAFDILGTGLVNSEYGINVGGRCCRDYNVGYSEDKRVYVSKQNYCGRAERRMDEQTD